MRNSVWIFLFLVLLTSCNRSHDEVWEDTTSASRHVTRGLMVLGGKQGDSREVWSREDFLCQQEEDLEFIPLNQESTFAVNDMPAPPPPKDKLPANQNESAKSLERVHFPLDSVKITSDNLEKLKNVVAYMKKNPSTYIFLEGHCDERGPEAYNLALGSRRSNTVKSHLLKEGIKADHVFTVSYGKGQPLAVGHNEDAWEKNRRVEFRVFQK